MKPLQVRIVDRGDPPPFALAPVVETEFDAVAILRDGMASGSTSLSFIAEVDGKIAFIQISKALFMGVAGALKGACASWGEDCA